MLGISRIAWKRIGGYRVVAILTALGIAYLITGSIVEGIEVSLATEAVHTCLHYGVERTCRDKRVE